MELSIHGNIHYNAWCHTCVPDRVRGGLSYMWWLGPLYIWLNIGPTAQRRLKQWLPVVLLLLGLFIMVTCACDSGLGNCDPNNPQTICQGY